MGAHILWLGCRSRHGWVPCRKAPSDGLVSGVEINVRPQCYWRASLDRGCIRTDFLLKLERPPGRKKSAKAQMFTISGSKLHTGWEYIDGGLFPYLYVGLIHVLFDIVD